MSPTVGRTSTFGLCNATLPYCLELAANGVDAFAAMSPGHAAAVNIRAGKIVNRAVADAFPDLPRA